LIIYFDQLIQQSGNQQSDNQQSINHQYGHSAD
jgi:hypothetical protein